MCPITSCVTKLHPGLLMCRYHWFQVPPQLRNNVLRTWRALEADMANVDKHAAYQDARDEAMASV